MSAAATALHICPQPTSNPTARHWPSGLTREPPLGAHLATARDRYTHHGVYAGCGMVIHYAGLATAWTAGPVEEVGLGEFAKGRPVWIIDHLQVPYAPSGVVERARSRLGERDYRVLTNNCEHFCNWCICGRSRSAQVKRTVVLPPLAMCLVLGLAVCAFQLVAG